MMRWSEGTVARHPEIIEQLQKQIILFRDLDAVHEIALCELLLGDAVRTLENDREQAQSLLKAAYDRFGTLKVEYYVAWTLHFIARLMGDTQGIQKGIEALNRALVLRRKLGDQIGAIYSLYNLSTDLLLLGDLDKCREVTKEILNISRVTGEQSSLLLGQITLTLLAFLEGRLDVVRTQNETNHALAAKLNHLLGLTWTNLIQVFVDYLDRRSDHLVENLGLSQKVTVQSVVGFFYALAYPFIQNTDDELGVHNLRSALRHADEFAAYGAQSLCLPFLASLEVTREHFIQAAQLLALSEAQPQNLMGWLPAWLGRTSLKERIEQKLAIETLENAYEQGRNLDVQSVIRSFMITDTEQGKTTSLIQQHILEANKQLVEPLSERELEVLTYIGKGLSNQGIANEIVVELSTVKKHLTHIYDKLEVGTRAQAILRAQELHLI
ncbi:MAG: LuxR C-terminal-related transcriptional regulator [Chloroflexota bacterium]